MAKKRVKNGKTLKELLGFAPTLEKGNFATVVFNASRKRIMLRRKIGDKIERKFFPVEDYAKANEAARNANKIGEQAGAGFGALRKEEEAALKFWREYVFRRTQGGKPPRPLVEILREAVEREETKDETPSFPEVATAFLEHKDKTRSLTLDYRTRIKNRLKTLSEAFAGVRMGEITIERLNDEISAIARPRSGDAPAEKTRKHWQALAKEVFDWFYSRENSTRRPSDKLANPLECLELQKITRKKDPETLPLEQIRALLLDLWKHNALTLPAVIVQLFCGLRNAEALRVRWRDIRDGEIILSRNYTKTRIARSVPVPPVAQAWFDAIKASGRLMPPGALLYPKNDTPEKDLASMPEALRKMKEETNFALRQKKFAGAIMRTCERLGIAKPENAFRHTAVSVMCKIYGFERAADYCGHSIKQQGDAYRNAISLQDAKDYFGIMPPEGDGKAIAFSRSRAKTGATGAAKIESGESVVPAAPEAFPEESATA